MKTEALKQALDKYGFDAAFGGARRDEEKSRAKERIFSFRSAQHRWDPKNQRPELWKLYNTRKHKGESIRVFPLSNWTELDVWQYIYLERIPVVPLYFAKDRPVVERDGTLIMVDDDRLPLRAGEVPSDAQGAVPHARLLPAHRRDRVDGRHAAGDHPGDAPRADLRAPGPRHRPRLRRVDGKEEAGRVLLMAHVSDLIAADIERYLKVHERKSLLRFITCGSVDDGKSTLIGRLLFESKLLYDDQLAALERDSRKFGTQGDDLDFALLVDGLAAEREQAITIDVAYRYFSTERRKYIVADTPGHEQYTRNMVTGASTADAAVLLVDARKGLLTQTRRHSYLVSLIGVRHVALAVNKMDLVDYSEKRFREIEAQYRVFAKQIGLDHITCIPVSALKGDNILAPSVNMPWYRGTVLMGWLETVEVDEARLQKLPFRLPVQWVNRPDLDFRGFTGTVASGAVKPGDRVRVQPAGKESRVARIVTQAGDLAQAVAGQSITLTLADEIDVSRGDLISAADASAEVADQFEATVVWMSDQPMLRGRNYLMKVGTKTVTATVAPLKYQVDVDTLAHLAAEKLELNQIGVCELELDQPIAFDAYADNRDTGGFILIDRLTNQTVGAGMLQFALRRAHNIHIQHVDVDKAARAALKGQRSCVLWLTGLSGSGKSTIANLVEKQLHAMGRHTYILDGDNVRHGLNKDLGFTAEDRVENIRRIAEVAKLMVDAGLIVVTAFISPFRAERRMARGLLQEGEFVEAFVHAPLAVAEDRDPKGLYKKARRGEIKNFTGIDSPYEEPEAPEIRIDTTVLSPEAAAEQVLAALRERGVIRGG